MAIKNKRTHERFDSLNLLSYFVYDEDDVTMTHQGMGRTLNVSRSGILLETHVPVEKGLLVALTLGLEDTLVDIRGRSVYSKAAASSMFETGIEFIDMDDNQQTILSQFIQAFEAQKNDK